MEEWQKAIQDQLQKVQKLEADYEADMIMRKVTSVLSEPFVLLEMLRADR